MRGGVKMGTIFAVVGPRPFYRAQLEGVSFKRKGISRPASRPGSQRVAMKGIFRIPPHSLRFHPLRPGTGRGPEFEQHALET